jgi:Rrf2 family protein
MFTIGRHTDYAARIVLHLACLKPGTRVTAREIAAKRLIPPAFIRRIISRLSAAGILATTRGSGGGIALAREASQISLCEVVEAFEGPLSLNGCVVEPGDCPLSVTCPVQGAWVKATRLLSGHLSEVRFGDLARGVEVVPNHGGQAPSA